MFEVPVLNRKLRAARGVRAGDCVSIQAAAFAGSVRRSLSHLCWKAALIQVSPTTSLTPAFPCGDPLGVSKETKSKLPFGLGFKYEKQPLTAGPHSVPCLSPVVKHTLYVNMCSFASSCTAGFHGEKLDRQKGTRLRKKAQIYSELLRPESISGDILPTLLRKDHLSWADQIDDCCIVSHCPPLCFWTNGHPFHIWNWTGKSFFFFVKKQTVDDVCI